MGAILVTGAAGFIGSHVVEALLARGDWVVGVDNFDPFYSEARKRRNLAAAVTHPHFRLVEHDVRDGAGLAACWERALPPEAPAISVVAHLAARAGPRSSLGQERLYQDINVRGTVEVLECARRFGVRQFVLTSTSSVYGNSPRSPFREDDPADRPLSPYAATKRATEVIAHAYHHVYGLPVTILRPFSVYGPRGRPDMTPALFVVPVWRGEPLVQFGDGSAGRNYTYIDDIVAGFLAAVDRPLGYEIINLANSQEVTLAAYFRVLGELLERPLRIEQRPMPASDPERTRADISKARRLLGYEPRTSFPTGLGRYLDWFRAELQAVPDFLAQMTPPA